MHSVKYSARGVYAAHQKNKNSYKYSFQNNYTLLGSEISLWKCAPARYWVKPVWQFSYSWLQVEVQRYRRAMATPMPAQKHSRK